MEAEILIEIKESEKKADEIVERSKKEKERILHEARANSSKLLSAKEDEIYRSQEKKLMDFKEKSRLLYEEKLGEGKAMAKQIKTKSEKNIAKAADFIIVRFEGML